MNRNSNKDERVDPSIGKTNNTEEDMRANNGNNSNDNKHQNTMTLASIGNMKDKSKDKGQLGGDDH